MPSFSKQSEDKLTTCDHRIQTLFYEIIIIHDCTIIEGHRSKARQEKLFNNGSSKVKFGNHNYSPSKAIDVAPYIPGKGIPWPKPNTPDYIKDLSQFYYFAGIVMDRALTIGIAIRWGGDWDRDNTLSDQSFDDLVHFELLD